MSSATVAVSGSDPGGGGGHGGVGWEGQPALVGAAEAAVVQNMVGNSGPEVCGDVVMVETAVEREEIAADTAELSRDTAPQHAEAESNKNDGFARYSLPPLDHGDLRVSDLVWSKLEGHPWWPGEIFDPSDASEVALKHQIDGSHLIAYAGDGTFAWCDGSQLVPFMTNYAHMEKQSSSDEFINAVNHALEELSRRILSGMSCRCLPEDISNSGMSYTVENHGLREGVTCSTVNRSEVLEYFRSENLLHYVNSLALSPGKGGDLLELVIACSQLSCLYRFKGCRELASFQTASGWADDTVDASSTRNIFVEEDATNVVHPDDHDKPKRGRGRPCKQKLDGGLESTKKNTASILTGPPSIAKPLNKPTENEEFDLSGDDSDDELTVLKRAKWRRVHKNHSADPKELLSQLYSVAIEPMNRNSFSTTTISYFCYYRNYAVSASPEASSISKIKPKMSGKRKNMDSHEVEKTDHMQDSYWSGLSLQKDPVHRLKRASDNTRPRRRRRLSQKTHLLSSQHLQAASLAPKEPRQVIERPIIHVDEKMVDELNPTALVLSFGRSAVLPSEMDVTRMFGRYGPLKETETEVHKSTDTVKVVFKKHADAERAFRTISKCASFGPSLRSFRLVSMPFSLSITDTNDPAHKDSGVPLNVVQVDTVNEVIAEAMKRT
ncbi:hypothetical protein ACP70R_040320 [Stipagrostis hirtigluma subsp. patula]